MSRFPSRNSPSPVSIRPRAYAGSGRIAHRRALAPSPGGSATVADESKVCRSPFSGTVAKISAQAGQTIQVNDVLLILEAMKMETVITAPIAGKVAKINVNVGDAVQQGQVLIEFE